jgi:DNA-directed RNA polymerase omega subunit
MATAKKAVEETEPSESPEIDSKYRLIILAAKRSKQLQRGARPRIEIDPAKHKPTRIALEEIVQGTVSFHLTANGEEQSDGPGK